MNIAQAVSTHWERAFLSGLNATLDDLQRVVHAKCKASTTTTTTLTHTTAATTTIPTLTHHHHRNNNNRLSTWRSSTH